MFGYNIYHVCVLNFVYFVFGVSSLGCPGGGVGPGGETLDIKDPHAEGVETEVGYQDAQDIHHESSFGLRVSTKIQ